MTQLAIQIIKYLRLFLIWLTL